MERNLRGFHHWVVRSITVKLQKIWTYGKGENLLIEEALREVGIEELEVYIQRSQNTVAQFISTRPIVDLCMEAERCPGNRVTKQW